MNDPTWRGLGQIAENARKFEVESFVSGSRKVHGDHDDAQLSHTPGVSTIKIAGLGLDNYTGYWMQSQGGSVRLPEPVCFHSLQLLKQGRSGAKMFSTDSTLTVYYNDHT